MSRSRIREPSAGPLIVDGGLASALEANGHELHPRLWSAGVFLEHPGAVEQVHESFLEAGADILISASYQMDLDGLAGYGLDHAESVAALRGTVAAARRAVERRGAVAMVAASIGPYGATLCDGSEYRGDYDIGEEELIEFHRPRFEILASAGADFLAFETIPSLVETRALLRLLEASGGVRAWFSFSCRDEARLADGEPIARAARLLDSHDPVLAVGVNCTAPAFVSGLMDEIRGASGKPIVVYPNSGETWDPEARAWSGEADAESLVASAREWADKGAWAVGGCCRVGPDSIRRIAVALRS